MSSSDSLYCQVLGLIGRWFLDQSPPPDLISSHAKRKGKLTPYPPSSQKQAYLSTYLTGRRKNPHWFCKNCGSTLGTDLTWLMENVLGDEEPRVTVNLRMLRDIRVRELKVSKREGMRAI